MAELVDAADSKSVFERSGSSSLPRGTKSRSFYQDRSRETDLESVFLCLAFAPVRSVRSRRRAARVPRPPTISSTTAFTPEHEMPDAQKSSTDISPRMAVKAKGTGAFLLALYAVGNQGYAWGFLACVEIRLATASPSMTHPVALSEAIQALQALNDHKNALGDFIRQKHLTT